MFLPRRTPRRLLALVGSAACLLALPSTASADTIGSTLASAPNGTICNSIFPIPMPLNCSSVFSSLTASETAAGGLNVPFNGVITGWRVRVAAGEPGDTSAMLRVLNGDTPIAKSLPVAVPVTGGTVSATAQVPVTAGERIGVTFAGTAPAFGSIGRVLYTAPSVGVVDNLLSPLTEGLPIVPTLTSGTELLLSADVEPDADGDSFGDLTQDLCPVLPALQTVCPNVTVDSPSYVNGSGVKLTLSEASKLSVKLERLTKGHRKAGKCSRRAKRGKRCTIAKKVKSLDNFAAPAGTSTVPIMTTKLRPGSYRATITAVGSSGKPTTVVVKFKIKKKRSRR